jgi:hypothetical protein
MGLRAKRWSEVLLIIDPDDFLILSVPKHGIVNCASVVVTSKEFGGF